jgi:hypothetical protein
MRNPPASTHIKYPSRYIFPTERVVWKKIMKQSKLVICGWLLEVGKEIL